MKIETGECIYCGQVHQFEVEDEIHHTEEEKNRKATELCDCEEAQNVHDRVEVKTKTQKNITALFHDDQPIMENIMMNAIDYIQDGTLTGIALKAGRVKGQMRITSKGKIKVEREKKMKTSLENQ